MDLDKLSAKEKMVYSALTGVIDPELQVDLISLGLIYDIKVDEKNQTCTITMTLTTMGCPITEMLQNMIKESVLSIGLRKCDINIVWNPQWSPKMMSREARLILGITG
ncbi:metal-sulfur cluster assembly factor [uncultured Lactobacillus sp.]|uniref:metal-sulfur cluster assembly factor n=1 Tax=uncultured Lactobacillus sp. TaxID=153152 RepID=UPI0025D164C0|nr:metal-sulfur cluster assembly factor [uncultured Lactobacillus sp.]